jgi:hypothetical protein
LFAFPGSVVDVGKLLSQLSKSEKVRSDLDLQLADSIKNLNEVKEVSNKQSNSKEKLQVRQPFHTATI